MIYIKWNPPKILTFILKDTYYIPIDKLKSTNKDFYKPITSIKELNFPQQ